MNLVVMTREIEETGTTNKRSLYTSPKSKFVGMLEICLLAQTVPASNAVASPFFTTRLPSVIDCNWGQGAASSLYRCVNCLMEPLVCMRLMIVSGRVSSLQQ
jgi:hypothetical protein